MITCPVCSKQFSSQEALTEHTKVAHPSYKPKESKKYIFYFVLLGIAAIVMYFLFLAPGKYDSFAQCITEKGATMYGAWWCPHCKDQEALFGSSFKHIKYVECSTPDGNSQYPICDNIGIKSYPTWIFADGSRTNQLTLEELSQKTSCPLPA